MTPQEINVAIAKVCGWKPTARKIKNYPTFQHADGRRCTIANLPNYYGDLNAMHEAEKVLSDVQVAIFAKELQRITKPAFGTSHFRRIWWANFIRATAAQRAEAFLRTLNLWETT